MLKKKATSTPSAWKSSDVNNEFFDTAKKEAEDGDLKKLDEYQEFLANGQRMKRNSPTFALASQRHGPNTGFYHNNVGKIPRTGSGSNTRSSGIQMCLFSTLRNGT